MSPLVLLLLLLLLLPATLLPQPRPPSVLQVHPAPAPPTPPLGGFKLASSGQQPAAQPLHCEAENPSYKLPTLSKPLSLSGHKSSRGWASGPLTHSQFALKLVGHIGTNRGTPTPHTLPLKHTVLVQVTWPRSASTRKVTQVKDGCIRVPFPVL